MAVAKDQDFSMECHRRKEEEEKGGGLMADWW